MMEKFKRCKVCDSPVELENSKFNLVKCKSCNLVFCNSIFSEDEFIRVYDKLYNSGPKSQYQVHSTTEINEMQSGKLKIGYNRKNLISKTINDRDRVLEIGSGNGLVGLYLKQKFENIIYKGIEIDHKIATRAQSFGLDILNDDFRVIKGFTDKFDVIMMWEVLEHIQDLNLCLELLKNVLNKDGTLLLSVPNYEKRLNYKNNNNKLFQSGPPIHLNYFTIDSLRKIFKLYGFKNIKIREKSMPYFNLKDPNFYSLLQRKLKGKFHGPTLYLIASV